MGRNRPFWTSSSRVHITLTGRPASFDNSTASIMKSTSRLLRRPQHRANDARVGAAAAKVVGERRTHVRLARPRIAIEQLFRRHDHATNAVAALRRLLLDEGTLQRMRLVERADAFYRRDLA